MLERVVLAGATRRKVSAADGASRKQGSYVDAV